MANRVSRLARGRTLGLGLKRRLLSEVRNARMAAGLSQRAVAQALGLSQAEYWRLENDRVDLDIVRLAEVGAVLGLDLSASLHPAGEPVRDTAQLKLIARFRALLASAWHVMIEAPFPTLGDLRSWDALVRLGSTFRVGVEAETRVRDQQELVRRMRQRELHGGVDEILILLSDSAHNRRLVAELRAALGERYATPPRVLLSALRAGRPLPGSGVILL